MFRKDYSLGPNHPLIQLYPLCQFPTDYFQLSQNTRTIFTPPNSKSRIFHTASTNFQIHIFRFLKKVLPRRIQRHLSRRSHFGGFSRVDWENQKRVVSPRDAIFGPKRRHTTIGSSTSWCRCPGTIMKKPPPSRPSYCGTGWTDGWNRVGSHFWRPVVLSTGARSRTTNNKRPQLTPSYLKTILCYPATGSL